MCNRAYFDFQEKIKKIEKQFFKICESLKISKILSKHLENVVTFIPFFFNKK